MAKDHDIQSAANEHEPSVADIAGLVPEGGTWADGTDTRPAASVEHIDPAARYWLRRSWTRLWWIACNPDAPLALMDTTTYYRAWTRDRLLAKLRRMNEPRVETWEEIRTRDLYA